MAGDDVKKSDANASGGVKRKEVKKETGLGLTNCKDDNFGEWYSEVVVNGELIEYYDISGCYILRPWAMSIWETMQKFFDVEIKKMNIQNCYFPLFVSPGVLQKEKDHVEGFAPEVAWVTKTGDSDLEVPIAIRPTSETVMYPYYSKWIRGHRDLPLKLNQWCNVVRWEFSNPTPFIRSREFLWQEGHTAFATKEEADAEIGVMVMVHGDDKGLVLPPKVATVQVIIIPVPYKDADTRGIFDACASAVDILSGAGIRAKADFRDNYSPGWKYSHWEMKGVPLRIEIGPKDLANSQVRVVRRDNSLKIDISRTNLVEHVKEMLNNIQHNLFDVAKQKRDACVKTIRTWDEFVEALSQKKLILAPWCDEEEVEKGVKARTKGEMGAAKSLCSPFDQPELPEGTKCFASGKPAKKWTYWGRSY
ncbi:proline--tRNA ligase, cytoplasmic isoform X3 [Juglans regia]|uniref:proline--tRNA ligase n=1 Tax=Juglans regia TaxID=51240 RepID=A0A2I4FMN0_JUGRE|nr:proline--tRNA ligase, cytoplasmic isoform X3 [Juglans regia]